MFHPLDPHVTPFAVSSMQLSRVSQLQYLPKTDYVSGIRKTESAHTHTHTHNPHTHTHTQSAHTQSVHTQSTHTGSAHRIPPLFSVAIYVLGIAKNLTIRCLHFLTSISKGTIIINNNRRRRRTTCWRFMRQTRFKVRASISIVTVLATVNAIR